MVWHDMLLFRLVDRNRHICPCFAPNPRLRMAKVQYDKAIIVSGDGDYFCLIEYLEMQKKLLHVIIPNKTSFSSLLRKYSSYFVYINDLRGKLEYRK